MTRKVDFKNVCFSFYQKIMQPKQTALLMLHYIKRLFFLLKETYLSTNQLVNLSTKNQKRLFFLLMFEV